MGPRGLTKAGRYSFGAGSAAALVCAAAGLLGASSAQAQSFDNATATSETVIVTPLSLVKQRDMDFGKIIQPTAAGTVEVSPDPTPVCTPSTGLIQFGNCQNAVFWGRGASGQTVRVKMLGSTTTTITNTAGNTMTVDLYTIDASPGLTYEKGNLKGNGFVQYSIADANGVFSFRIGGTLHVGANQAGGNYSGTFQVDISYQ